VILNPKKSSVKRRKILGDHKKKLRIVKKLFHSFQKGLLGGSSRRKANGKHHGKYEGN
jgi:hypothetical protein